MHIKDFIGKRVHMIGIGGSSMSGLAEMLKKQGIIVTGSDSSESHTAKKLRLMDIPVAIGHHPEIIEGSSLVVFSAAIHEDDPERMQAEKLNIPQMERAELLGQLMQNFKERICVCGTHGKTTTGAMLSQLLLNLDLDPTVHLGGRLDAIGGSTRTGSHDYFVAEACEFNRSFLKMSPTIALLLNIEQDHMDTYGNMENLEQAFFSFLSLLPTDGVVIANAEDERSMRLLGKLPRRAVTFGLNKGDWQVKDLVHDKDGRPSFKVMHHGELVAESSLGVGGDFNVLHALAALACVNEIKGDLKLAAASLSNFTGAHRRFEHTGNIRGMKMYHDYGHNPAEMQAALRVAKLQNRRVIAVMQPHTYSRVISLFDDYLTCTSEADLTLVTDIYGAREKDPGTINSQMLVDGMRRNGINAYLTPSFDDAENFILKNGREGDLVLTMGCGNINLLNEQMQKHYDNTEEE